MYLEARWNLATELDAIFPVNSFESEFSSVYLPDVLD